jgi:hypothetical protein
VQFDESGEYVAGKAQDQRIYVWELKNPPRVTAKPVVPSLALSGYQTAAFCSTEYLLVSNEDGSVYSYEYKSPTHILDQVGRLTSSAQFRVGNNADTVFVFDTVRLLAGRCGRSLQNISEQNSRIENLADDGAGNIVLIARREITRIGRAFYILGLPIWKIDWPSIKREPSQSDANL